MSVENIHRVPEEDESSTPTLNLRVIILIGLATYIVVGIIANIYRTDIPEKADEEWIGTHADVVISSLGQPEKVVEDGQGGSILKYRRLHVQDHYYAVERFDIFVTSLGEVYGFSRDS